MNNMPDGCGFAWGDFARWVFYGRASWPSYCFWIVPGTVTDEDRCGWL